MKGSPDGSLRRNVGWMFLGQGSGYLLRAVYFVMIARLLGVVQYGLVVGAFALVNIAAQYSRLGTGMTLLRYVSIDRGEFAVYWGNVLLVTVPVGLGLTGLLWVLAPHLIAPGSAAIVVFTSIAACICEQLTISATQVFQAFERMRVTAVLNLLTSLARTVTAGVLLLVLHRATAWQWALASMIVSGVATLVAMGAVTRAFGAPRFRWRRLRERSLEGVGYSFASSTTSAYDDLDKAMLSHYGMSAANGIYALAYRIIEMATMPIASIQLAAEPRLFQLGAQHLRDSWELSLHLLKKSLGLSAAIAALLFAGSPLLTPIVGKGFAEAASALRWLCLIPVFRSVHYIAGSVLTTSGLQRYRTATQLVAALLNFVVNLWLIPRYGWHGAAWSSLGTDAALGLLNLGTVMWLLRPQTATAVTTWAGRMER